MTVDQVAADLDLSAPRVRAALDVSGVDPAEVWLLRDHLEQVVQDTGGTPQARQRARRWFTLRDAPRRPGDAAQAGPWEPSSGREHAEFVALRVGEDHP